MMMVRQDQPAARRRQPPTRLNLLLSCGQGQEDPAVVQLPRLLAPMGIHSIRATSGEGAAGALYRACYREGR